MKPNNFEIYVDEELIPQPATTADYQLILENDILKLNYKSFTQIIVLGSASFKPFMQLKLGDRREIIEDLLDISVFSEMNLILKGKIKETKEEQESLIHKIQLVKERHSSKREYIKKVAEDHKRRLEDVNTKLENITKDLERATTEQSGFADQVLILENSISGVGNVEENLQTITKSITDLKMKIYTAEQEHEKAVNDRVSSETLKEKIHTNNGIINEGRVKLGVLNADLADTIQAIDAYGTFDDRDQIKADIAIKSSKRIAEQTRLNFYEEHDDCPECKQGIDPKFKDNTIYELLDKIATYDEDLAYCIDRDKVITREMKEKADFEKKKKKLEGDIAIVNTAIDKLESQNTVLQEDINSREVKESEDVEKLEDTVVLLKVELASFVEDLKDLKTQNDVLTKFKKDLIVVQKDSALCEQSINTNTIRQANLNKELEKMNDVSTKDEQYEIDALVLEIKDLDIDLGKKKNSLHYFGIVQKLLRDDGLKTKIIKKFLPIINATANMYLDKFDFPINFTFDENFNETIQSNYRNDFCYYSFSEGEKSRIDLALLFTWREIALKKSRNATNIIIFDEIFDGSLDGDGIENFMSILGVDKEGYNSFIISHKDETINSRFDRTVEFIKKGHFSKMMEK